MTNQMVSSQKKSAQLAKSHAAIEQFLSFYLEANQQALLPTQQLLEIARVSLTEITAIAGLAPSVMGIYNWRGDVIWVVDLASLLGYKPLYAQQHEQEKLHDNCHIVFLRSQDNLIGLAMPRVGQIVKFDISTIQTSALTFANPAMMKACQGYWLSASEETFLVLDGDAIAEIVST
jgi:positive phototaxis protein PixI